MAQLARIAIGFTLSAIFCLAAPLAARATDLPSTGAVVVEGHIPGAMALGAGTVLSASDTSVRIITANHVASVGNLTVRLPDGSQAPAHIVVAFAANDLAVIEATVTSAQAAAVHPATIATPHSNEPVSIRGGSETGPVGFETGSISKVGAELPDGPANGRYALACGTCHQGDSGGGIFNASGELVGVYVGYFEMDDNSRVSVAQMLPLEAMKIARSNTSTTPATVALSTP